MTITGDWSAQIDFNVWKDPWISLLLLLFIVIIIINLFDEIIQIQCIQNWYIGSI